MKLNKQLKSKIDKYFDNISPEELYSVLTEKYNFMEDNEFLIDKLKHVDQTEIYSESITYVVVSDQNNHDLESLETKSIGDNEDLLPTNLDKSSIPLAA